jgi:hypothetical protein
MQIQEFVIKIWAEAMEMGSWSEASKTTHGSKSANCGSRTQPAESCRENVLVA